MKENTITESHGVDRAERERAAYDDGAVWEHADRWHRRFPHVFSCPNTRWHEQLFEDLLRAAVSGRRVLELGCGDGTNAERLLALGASYVYGIDVSDAFVARAQARARPGVLEFASRDASQRIDGAFDAIVGRSILHHIDYRPILRRLYDETLTGAGSMIFMEPLGSNPLILLYTALVPRAHTSDERSFTVDDLRWLRREFDAQIHPFNCASLPAGLVSSFVSSRPDNLVLRATDRFDRWLAGRALWSDSLFRHAILVIRKASGGAAPR